MANALEESIKVANADKHAAAVLWKNAQKATESVDELVELLNDPGFEFTPQPHRIAYFAAFLNRIGGIKARSRTGRSCSGRRRTSRRAIDRQD